MNAAKKGVPFRPKVDTVLALIAEHNGNLTTVATALGCSRTTLYKYIAARPSVAAALDEARERMLDEAESVLYTRAIAGETAELLFFLKTQGKRRGYVERVEQTGKDGGPIQARAEVTYDFDTDAYAAAFAAFYGAPDEPESARGHGDEQPVGSADTDAEAGAVSDDAGH